MPPRKRKIQADSIDDKPIRIFVLDSYTFLKKFEKSAADNIRDQASTRPSSVKQIAVYRRLLEIFGGITDHSSDDLEADRRLVSECDGWCDFFRNQITSLYALPIKHIFQPTQKSVTILSSPLLGLMSYIYHVKLEECWARHWTPSGARFLNDKISIGESWENILSAFGIGMRLHVNNATPGPKLIQFQELAAEVLYEFVSKVMRSNETERAVPIADHVKRSLLDAVDALSGGCAANKELIKSPNIIGPSLLSTIIWEHSDFMTANIALQLAFTVAPSLKSGQGKGKKATSAAEARKSRTTWFNQIFPASKFGKDVHEELVPRIVDMASKKFWNEIGGIQGRIVRDHDSKARAMPIMSGSIDGKMICWNEHTTPVFRNCVQFNKSTLTWCSSAVLGENPDDWGEERTAEIEYQHILNAQLTVRDAEKSNSDTLTLTIDCKNQPVVDGLRPSLRENQANDNCQSRLILIIDAQYDIILARTLRARKINFSTSSGRSEKLTVLEKAHHAKNNGPIHMVETSGMEGGHKRNMPKVSISREPVCALDADEIQRKTDSIPQISSSYQRAATVQREARSDVSREDDAILDHGKSFTTKLVDQHGGVIKNKHDSTSLDSLIHPHEKNDLHSVVVVTSESSSKDTLVTKSGTTRRRPQSALDVSQNNVESLDRGPKMIVSPGATVVSNAVSGKTNEMVLGYKRMQASVQNKTSVLQPRKSAVTNKSREVSIEILETGLQKAFDKAKSTIEYQEPSTGPPSAAKGNGQGFNPVRLRGSEKPSSKTRETRRIQPMRSSHLNSNKNIDEALTNKDDKLDNMPLILRLSDIEDMTFNERQKGNYSGSSTHSAARDSRTKVHDIKIGHQDAFESESSDMSPDIGAEMDNDLSTSIFPDSVVQKKFGELAARGHSKELHAPFPQQVKRPTSFNERVRSKKDDPECEAWEPTNPNYLKLESQRKSNMKEKPFARSSYETVDALSKKADDDEDSSNPKVGDKREWRPKKAVMGDKSTRNAACGKEKQTKFDGGASAYSFAEEKSSSKKAQSSNGRYADAIRPDDTINQGRNHGIVLKAQVNSKNSIDLGENYWSAESRESRSRPKVKKEDRSNLARIPSNFQVEQLKKNEEVYRLDQRAFSRQITGGGGSDQSNSTDRSLEIEQFPSSPLRRHSSAFKKVEEIHPKRVVRPPEFFLGQSVLAPKTKDVGAPGNITEEPESNKSKQNRQLRFESPKPVYKRKTVVDSRSNMEDFAKRRKNSHDDPKTSRGQSSRLSEDKGPQQFEAKHKFENAALGKSQTRLYALAKLIDETRTSGKGSGVDLRYNKTCVDDGNERFDDAHHIAPLNTELKSRSHRSSRLRSPEDGTPLFRPESSPLQKPKEKGQTQSLLRSQLLKHLSLPNSNHEVSSKKETVRMNGEGLKKQEGSRLPNHEQDMSECMGKLTQMIIDNIGRKKTNTKRAAFHTQLGVLRLTKNVMRECIQQSEEVLNVTLKQANQRQEQYDGFYATIKATSEKMDREVKWMKKFLKARDEEVS